MSLETITLEVDLELVRQWYVKYLDLFPNETRRMKELLDNLVEETLRKEINFLEREHS